LKITLAGRLSSDVRRNDLKGHNCYIISPIYRSLNCGPSKTYIETLSIGGKQVDRLHSKRLGLLDYAMNEGAPNTTASVSWDHI
jgi:hypothetical protein